jgi:hypothetical protein
MGRSHQTDSRTEESPLTREQIVGTLQAHRERLRQFGVTRISLFGSAARGQIGPESDIDMVVEFSGITYRRFVAVKSFLEPLFGRRVDLLTPPAVQGRLKQEIERDMVHVST